MEQITIQKMKLSEQLIKNLHDLGFEEFKPGLYRKSVSENTFLYRDYRKKIPLTYAYFHKTWVDPNQFREAKVIEKIEQLHIEQNPEKITAY